MFGSFSVVLVGIFALANVSQGLGVTSRVPGLSEVLEIVERREVIKVVETVFENYEHLDACHDTLSWSFNITACEQLAEDLGSFKDFLFTAVEDAIYIADEAETLKAEYATCSTESILKQIKCYSKVITAAESLIKEADAEEQELAEDGEAIVQEIKSDYASCFDKGFTIESFNKKMRQCKLNLKMKRS